MNLTFQVKQSITAYESCLYGISIRGDESVFATVGLNQLTGVSSKPILKFWRSDHKPLQPFASFACHDNYVHSLSFLDSAPLLASCSSQLCVVDYEKKVLLSTVKPSSPFTCMVTSSSSITAKGVAGSSAWQQIFCATRNSDLICYDLRQKFYDVRVCANFPFASRVDASPENHVPAFICAIASCEDLYIAVAWNTGVVRILSQRVGSPIFEWHAHSRAIAKLEFIGTTKLLTACVDGSVSVWELSSGNTPSLYARFVNLNAIKNANTISVVDFGMGLDVVSAVGDSLLSCNDVDLREYSQSSEETVHMYSMNAHALCDGITSAPLSKLNMCVNVMCPLRRIALCGSEDGKLFVVQLRVC